MMSVLHFSQQGNYTELCKNCKNGYKELNELYSGMEKNATMCIDIEDAVCMSGAETSRTPLLQIFANALMTIKGAIWTIQMKSVINN